MAREKDRKQQSRIARERIGILLERAAALEESDSEGKTALARLAHRIALRCNVKIPKHQSQAYCRKCQSYLSAGMQMTRLDSTNRVKRVRCLRCGYVRNHRY